MTLNKKGSNRPRLSSGWRLVEQTGFRSVNSLRYLAINNLKVYASSAVTDELGNL
jgi:hypothetical protein